MDDTSLKRKPHYHIYKLGREFWNKWMEEEAHSLYRFSHNYMQEVSTPYRDKIETTLKDISDFCQKDPDQLFPSDLIDFKSTVWNEKADFEGFVFRGEVNFEFSVFEKEATFLGATFHKRALFMNCRFLNAANFINSEVKMLLSFFQVRFSTVPFINGLSLNGIISFDGADWPKAKGDSFLKRQTIKFLDSYNVSKMRVLGVRHLYRELFLKSNSNISEKFNKGFSLIRKDVERYFDEKPKSESYKEASISNVKSAYGYLKYLANQVDNHEVEMVFFRRELHAKSIMKKTGISHWFVIFMYGLVSGYGKSIVRPLVALVASLLIFSLVYYSMFGGYLSWQMCFGISLDNTFIFLPTDKLLSGWDVNIRPVNDFQFFKYKFLRMSQLMISIILVFLVALGIRNELRIK